jgi:hypothetical protein
MFSSGYRGAAQLPVGLVRFFLVVFLPVVGPLSDSALWHRCFFDPPEPFDLAAPSGSRQLRTRNWKRGV